MAIGFLGKSGCRHLDQPQVMRRTGDDRDNDGGRLSLVRPARMIRKLDTRKKIMHMNGTTRHQSLSGDALSNAKKVE